MGIKLSCWRRKPPERQSSVTLLTINMDIFKNLTPEYYLEKDIEDIYENFELNEFMPIRINSRTMSQAVDNITQLLRLKIKKSILTNLKTHLKSYGGMFIVHFESNDDNCSLIYWKLIREETIFCTLIHPNSIQLGAFIVNDILAYNLISGHNGLQKSVVIQQGNFQIIHPLMLIKDPDSYPDLITYAIASQNHEIAKFLSDLDYFDKEINQWTQIDYAYKENFMEHVLLLLQLNSQFPRNFQLNENHLDELKDFINNTLDVHKAIPDGVSITIESSVTNNPGLKYFYNFNNQSAMARAIEYGNLEIVQYFIKKRIGLGPHESLEKLKKYISLLNEKKVARIHDDFFQPHIMKLNSNLGFNPSQNFQSLDVIFESYKQLNTIKEVQILLKSVAAIEHSKVIFDYSTNIQIDYCKIMELFEMGRIYIKVENLIETPNTAILNGRIAHAFCHYVMLKLYENDCKPFREQNEEWNIIMTKYPTKVRKDPIFVKVFEDIEENYRDAELIARYAEIHARNLNIDNISNTIRNNYQSLRTYYDQCTFEMQQEILANQTLWLRIKKLLWRYPKMILGYLALLLLGMIVLGVLIAVSITSSNRQENVNCGKIHVAIPLAHGAKFSEKGQWPWFASLYDRSNSNRFFCGSTIISKKHLLLAAHCIQPKNLPSRAASEIFTFIGRYDLKDDNEEHSVKMNITEIFIHKDWFKSKHQKSYNGDIAILLLEHEITFNDYVQPICFPDSKMKVENIEGFVAGYGKNESEQIVDKIKHIEIPTVKNCSDDKDYRDIVSKTMFCAGKKGKAPCKGDSGGGFYHEKANHRWQILGIVSSAPSVKCDGNNLATFTNVVDHLEWIYGILSNPENKTKIMGDKSTNH